MVAVIVDIPDPVRSPWMVGDAHMKVSLQDRWVAVNRATGEMHRLISWSTVSDLSRHPEFLTSCEDPGPLMIIGEELS